MSRSLDFLVDGLNSSLSDAARAVFDRDPDTADESTAKSPVCRCRTSFETPVGLGLSERCELVVDAGDCPGRGRLESAPACRATVIDALSRRDVDTVRTRCAGRERTYTDAALALLVAAWSASRFTTRRWPSGLSEIRSPRATRLRGARVQSLASPPNRDSMSRRHTSGVVGTRRKPHRLQMYT